MAQRFIPLLGKLAKWSAAAGSAVFIAQECLFDVDGGHRAVIFDRFRGVLDDTYGEGMHFRLPFLQYPYIIDVRTRPRVISTMTGTKDLQMVNISLRVLSHPDVEFLPWIYVNLGMDFDYRVLPSIGNEVLKAVVAQFNADQLLTQREKVSLQIRDQLTVRASDFHLTLDDVAITHLTFGREFTAAIEQKQVAYQDAERAKYIVERSEYEKQASIIRAEGEAEAAELISAAITSGGSGVIEVRRIDAARDIADILSRSRNITYLPGQGNNVLLSLQ